MAPTVSISVVREILRLEFHRFFLHPRSLYGVPLLIAGLYVAVQKSAVTPLAVVFLIWACTLEAQFTNILYRSQKEFDRFSLFALPWEDIVLVKNLATIAIAFLVLPAMTVLVLYFSPVLPGPEAYVEAGIYFLSVIFVLLIYGNARSVRNPRKDLSWTFRDYAEALWMPVFLTAFSIPFFVLTVLPSGHVLVLAYSLGASWIWYARSIPRTANYLRTHRVTLCELP